MNLKLLVLGLIVFAPNESFALRNSFAISYECLSIDGVPISKDTDLARKCCSGGQLVSNPAGECRVGFFGVLPSAVGDGLGAFALAQNVIEGTGAIANVQTNLQSTATTPGSGNVPSSQSSALVSSGSIGGTGASSAIAEGLLPGANNRGSGASGGMSAGGGPMGSGSGLSGTLGRNSKDGSRGVGAADASIGAYASKGPVEKGALDPGGSGKVSPNDGSVERMNLGPNDEASAGSGLTQAGDDLLTGSREDAADYLNRIDRNLSIFKVVSKRYEREISRSRVRAVEIK